MILRTEFDLAMLHRYVSERTHIFATSEVQDFLSKEEKLENKHQILVTNTAWSFFLLK